MPDPVPKDGTSAIARVHLTLPEFWQNAPELYFFHIEASFHSANITQEIDKYYKLVEALPPTILSQVQTLLRDPPADSPYTKLKDELLRLTAVSDRQRYHTLDDKFFKEMFLALLPKSVQTILASCSDDLDVATLARKADHILEVERLAAPTVAQVSQPVTTPAPELAELKAQVAQMSATLATLQLRKSTHRSVKYTIHPAGVPLLLFPHGTGPEDRSGKRFTY
ncbi:unnamed protein product [Dibothriocephalus latus]|uniref:DUF7041 domain-containing protein n=1 Tax=Dibothriocephalus latus TaxID=60516 RepID=A0A3P7LGD9_DIBLA|nr:unnamed protein product [Dibothriocephalus latus]